jgi:hypothetical protein
MTQPRNPARDMPGLPVATSGASITRTAGTQIVNTATNIRDQGASHPLGKAPPPTAATRQDNAWQDGH